MRDSCFVKDTAFDELEDRQELKQSSALYYKMNVVQFDPSYNIRNARAQTSSAHDVLLKKNIKISVSLMDSVMAPAAHDHIFCSDAMFFY